MRAARSHLGRTNPAPRRQDGSPHSPGLAQRSPGKPLDADVRAFFEPRLGHDLSRVRVHTDRSAEKSAQALGARAYTAGEHIVFAANQHGRGAPNGLGLLAHELTHVAQQMRGGPAANAEAGARAATEWMAGGQPAAAEIAGGAKPGIYRNGEDEPPPLRLDWNILPSMFQPAPSLLDPPKREPLIPMPPLGTDRPAQKLPPAPPTVEPPKASPPKLEGDSPAPPHKRAATPVPPSVKPKVQPPSQPGVARVALPGTGKLDVGFRFSAPSIDIKGVPGVPFVADVSQARAEVVRQQLTGAKPPGPDPGDLAKISWSLFSTYFAADWAAKMAAKLGKPSTGPQVDLMVSIPSGDSGVSVRAKYSGAGLQALGAARLTVTYQW